MWVSVILLRWIVYCWSSDLCPGLGQVWLFTSTFLALHPWPILWDLFKYFCSVISPHWFFRERLGHKEWTTQCLGDGTEIGVLFSIFYFQYCFVFITSSRNSTAENSSLPECSGKVFNWALLVSFETKGVSACLHWQEEWACGSQEHLCLKVWNDCQNCNQERL